MRRSAQFIRIFSWNVPVHGVHSAFMTSLYWVSKEMVDVLNDPGTIFWLGPADFKVLERCKRYVAASSSVLFLFASALPHRTVHLIWDSKAGPTANV